MSSQTITLLITRSCVAKARDSLPYELSGRYGVRFNQEQENQ